MSTTRVHRHAGHSHGHGHGHSHDNTYLTSSNKNDAGVRITRIGLFVNLGMAIGKGVGGVVFHSQALVADAFHALTDLVSDFMTLATISWSLKPATPQFPNGFGKVESLGALGVSGLLLFGGLGMGLNGLDALYVQTFADHAHEHVEHSHGLFSFLGHSHSHAVPSLNAAWLAAGSIVVKEWLYRATMKIAKERRSAVLASNAVHHRIDSLTSIVALLTIVGSHFFTNAAWLDPVGGIIISAMVIRAGYNNTVASLLELGDVTVDDDVKAAVRFTTNKILRGDTKKGLDAVVHGSEAEIRYIEGVKSGQNYLLDIELAVPKTFTLEQTMVIEDAVIDRVAKKIRGARRVRVNFVPLEDQSSIGDDFIPPEISFSVSPESEEEHEHDHDHAHTHDHTPSHKHSNGHVQEPQGHEQKKNK